MTVCVVVHLHAGLSRYAPDGSRGAVTIDLPDGARVADVLARFSFTATRRTIVGLNGEAAAPDAPVPDGARIDLLEPISGGADPLVRHGLDGGPAPGHPPSLGGHDALGAPVVGST